MSDFCWLLHLDVPSPIFSESEPIFGRGFKIQEERKGSEVGTNDYEPMKEKTTSHSSVFGGGRRTCGGAGHLDSPNKEMEEDVKKQSVTQTSSSATIEVSFSRVRDLSIAIQIQLDSIDLKGTKNGYPIENKSGFHVSRREVISLSMGTKDLAATRIQTAFRAYKVEIGNRRVYKGQIKQLELEERFKVESKLHELKMKWCGSPHMIMETESKIQQRDEAANKRERALAYAFSHQWRANSSRYFGQAYYDLSKESWGWNWTGRWIAVYRLGAHVVVRPIVSQRPKLQKEPCERKKMFGNTET
ncbi:hypothetical protein L1887_39551 [Cichorium endivia]|nr:hypothetical protein L1887_39551 [Cichorium endivia]